MAIVIPIDEKREKVQGVRTANAGLPQVNENQTGAPMIQATENLNKSLQQMGQISQAIAIQEQKNAYADLGNQRLNIAKETIQGMQTDGLKFLSQDEMSNYIETKFKEQAGQKYSSKFIDSWKQTDSGKELLATTELSLNGEWLTQRYNTMSQSFKERGVALGNMTFKNEAEKNAAFNAFKEEMQQSPLVQADIDKTMFTTEVEWETNEIQYLAMKDPVRTLKRLREDNSWMPYVSKANKVKIMKQIASDIEKKKDTPKAIPTRPLNAFFDLVYENETQGKITKEVIDAWGKQGIISKDMVEMINASQLYSSGRLIEVFQNNPSKVRTKFKLSEKEYVGMLNYWKGMVKSSNSVEARNALNLLQQQEETANKFSYKIDDNLKITKNAAVEREQIAENPAEFAGLIIDVEKNLRNGKYGANQLTASKFRTQISGKFGSALKAKSDKGELNNGTAGDIGLNSIVRNLTPHRTRDDAKEQGKGYFYLQNPGYDLADEQRPFKTSATSAVDTAKIVIAPVVETFALDSVSEGAKSKREREKRLSREEQLKLMENAPIVISERATMTNLNIAENLGNAGVKFYKALADAGINFESTDPNDITKAGEIAKTIYAQTMSNMTGIPEEVLKTNNPIIITHGTAFTTNSPERKEFAKDWVEKITVVKDKTKNVKVRNTFERWIVDSEGNNIFKLSNVVDPNPISESENTIPESLKLR